MEDKEKIAKAKSILQIWIDKQGHERCWYYPDLFNELSEILDIKPKKSSGLPSLEEFKCGCERYQAEEFGYNKQDRVAPEKLEKYKDITSRALKIVKKAIIRGKESEAKEIISMAANYLSDAGHFERKGDYVNAFAALNYAHGWIDSGVRLGVFDVSDDRLFTVK